MEFSGNIDIVLCSESLTENPYSEMKRVSFVSGDLKNAEVLKQACVQDAAYIIIDSDNDEKSILRAVAVFGQVPKGNIALMLNCGSSRESFELIAANMHMSVEVIEPLDTGLLVQAVRDKGSSIMIDKIVNVDNDDTISQDPVPKNFVGKTYGELFIFLKEKHNATLLGLGKIGSLNKAHYSINTPNETILNNDQSIYYIAGKKLNLV